MMMHYVLNIMFVCLRGVGWVCCANLLPVVGSVMRYTCFMGGIWYLIIILLVSHLSFYLWCLSMLFHYDVAISYILLLSVLLFILKFICLGFLVVVSGAIFFEN